MMKYKGYIGHVELDEDAGLFHGEVVNTRDVITFQGQTPQELQTAFRESIDDYIDFCRERGEEPEKPFSGHFMVRVGPDLHKAAAASARLSRKSLNAWMADAIEKARTV